MSATLRKPEATPGGIGSGVYRPRGIGSGVYRPRGIAPSDKLGRYLAASRF
ncbi:MAG TPA: hypothetical protein P5079_01950 [Elusimicrobiota bacterium]|nr:hypothetical protein [Elusimicrobiota bacterium]